MKLGVCGDRCDVCPRYVATRDHDALLFEKIRRVYIKVGLRGEDTPLESLTCRGCSPENKCAYSSVRDCALDRKIENCGLCSDYPCEKMNAVFQKTEDFRNKFDHACTKEEFTLFEQAFFRKKAYLGAAASVQQPPKAATDTD